jgi:hypothetical protein
MAPDRLMSVMYYLGFAPLFRGWRSRSSNPFLQHHFAQAMAIFFLLIVWFLMVFSLDVIEFLILVCLPDLDRHLDSWELWLTVTLLVVLGGLMLLWLVLLGLGLAGSTRELPWFKRLTRKPRVICVSYWANVFAIVLIPITLVLACHANSLTRTCRDDAAAVYFLYDDGIPVPRWAYALGLYRISLQAQRNWGSGSTVLDRLNSPNLRAALAHGKVVFLGTHGDDGYAYVFNQALPRIVPGTLRIGPPDTEAGSEIKIPGGLCISVLGTDNNWSKPEHITVNRGLRLAYIFACNAGKKSSQWHMQLAPAHVVIYNRPSTLYDHAWWFAVTGPAKLRRLD